MTRSKSTPAGIWSRLSMCRFPLILPRPQQPEDKAIKDLVTLWFFPLVVVPGKNGELSERQRVRQRDVEEEHDKLMTGNFFVPGYVIHCCHESVGCCCHGRRSTAKRMVHFFRKTVFRGRRPTPSLKEWTNVRAYREK